MKDACPLRVFLCNGAPRPKSVPAGAHVTALNYLNDDPERLVTLRLPKFVDQLYHLPDRILDLLELAAYVFAADRATFRGAKDAVEYHAWPRAMLFSMRVRDAEFWNQPRVKEKLSAAIRFMTGDCEYSFDFLEGHTTPPTSLFDREEFAIAPRGPASVALFSGGLDSLAGVLERLATTSEDIYLISHRSGQPSTKKTQAALVRVLCANHPGRVHHYSFDCGLAHVRGVEETQRTRAFLFGSIAFAVAHRIGLDSFFAFENGVTSLNFLRRQDLMNARASRTTHPQTHALMADFFAEVRGGPVRVLNPFWTKTKADVFALLDKVGGRDLINSSVSCSKTFNRLVGSATHCGCCFQCVDRRIAAYAAGLHEIDNAGIYSADIFRDRIEADEARTTALDYVRQAVHFATATDDGFFMERLAELSDVTPFVGMEEDAAVDAVWALCRRHGEQVLQGLDEVRRRFDDLRFPLADGSLLQLIATRAHLVGDAADKGPTLATVQAGILELQQMTNPISGAVARIEKTVATVHEHVRGVPVMQADLAEARVAPEAAALEIYNRIADILTPEEQTIWRAVRNSGGSQKNALESLRKSGVVKSAATLSRRVRGIDEKLRKNNLPPCNASSPAMRFTKGGGHANEEGMTVTEEISAVERDWADDPADRDTTIRAYLAASPEGKASFEQRKPGIKDEAAKHLGRHR
ncbi:MAG TPA: hypothetical protein PLU30_18155 [Verrucomicrobiae bacterium]|nr:hypothetical protein [Verrucomicrobiae bacterium]